VVGEQHQGGLENVEKAVRRAGGEPAPQPLRDGTVEPSASLRDGQALDEPGHDALTGRDDRGPVEVEAQRVQARQHRDDHRHAVERRYVTWQPALCVAHRGGRLGCDPPCLHRLGERLRLARPQPGGHLLVADGPGQRERVASPVVGAVVAERGERGLDDQLRLRRPARPPPPREQLHLGGVEHAPAPVAARPPAQDAPADVGVQRGRLDPEPARGLRGVDLLHTLIIINVDTH
jgi:hypothetical protein